MRILDKYILKEFLGPFCLVLPHLLLYFSGRIHC